ncbi:hypothetical protein [Ureibacillus sinduriensis]|uniref:Uncharacterized protein n=1 Tax=Ureibacillus sinduriensis BLB-1 = JCM 15800 TaxID=1384057 RepID=A0A0A3HQF4_9BACL|nr:hypothetical protein [Ureibacillus sinduriensis]KGR74639.1 hypothetical protein CD33_16250 [Ureibacillus sinduriensis BLB-1 = JCM 15800]
MWKQYVSALMVGALIAIFKLPLMLAVVLLMFISLWIMGEFLYVVYRSTNMKKVEKFIISKKKEPIYQYVYTQGFGSLEEQILALDKIIQKYKQPHIHYYYSALRELLSDNFAEAWSAAEKIGKEPFMSYTKAVINVKTGNIQSAKSYKFDKEWMAVAIMAMIAAENKDKEAFELHSTDAIDAARGVQRLSLIYSFKAMDI